MERREDSVRPPAAPSEGGTAARHTSHSERGEGRPAWRPSLPRERTGSIYVNRSARKQSERRGVRPHPHAFTSLHTPAWNSQVDRPPFRAGIPR